VAAAAGVATLTVGTLADAVEHVGGRLVAAFRERYPHVQVTPVEAALGDPTAGLRAGLVDVAPTRTPFDDTGITTAVASTEAVGVVVRTDDPLAQRASVVVGELGDRRWVRLPADTDPAWTAYWTGPSGDGLPVHRTIQECLQSVLWNRMSALAPLGQAVPDGLVVVAATDRPPSCLVVAWPRAGARPLARAFAMIAAG
jgi:DNA-binding transcriptional LysR family regulator